MTFLLDTNVISETVRARPDRNVLDWIEDQNPHDLYLAAQTIGELVRVTRNVEARACREQFESWIEHDLAGQFKGRILSFEATTATVWGRLLGDGDRAGRRPSAADAQITAVAIQHDLTMVTRNVRDFQRFEIRLLNPWQRRPSSSDQ